MTVLRSRKILSTVTPKSSQPLAPENVVAEPVTPSKTSEFLNPSSNSTSPSSNSPTQNCGHLEIGFGSGDGSIMVSECGIVRRVSARLAKKVGISEYTEHVAVVSGKRKKVEGTSLNGEFDARNSGRSVYDLKLGVASSGGIPDPIIIQPILQDMGDGGVTKLVKEREKIKDGVSVAKLGFDYDVEASMVETVNSGRRKRRFSMEVIGLQLESLAEDEVEKGLLSLRSGRRVVKRNIIDDIGCAGNLFEGIENSKESGVILSGDVLSESKSGANVEEDENGDLKERIFSRREEGKGKFGSETSVIIGSAPMNFELHDRTLSFGDLNQNVINFTKSANSKEAVEDKGGFVDETGVKTRRRVSIEEKGKMKLGIRASPSSGINTVELEVENVNGSSVSALGDLNQDVINFTKSANSKKVVKDKGGIVIETGVKTRKRVSIEEKGKMKLGVKASPSSGISTVELEVENVNGSSVSALGDLNQEVINFRESANSKEVVIDEGGIVIETGEKTKRRLTIEEKGKMKVGVRALLSSGINTAELEVENVNGNSVSGADHSATNEALQDRVQVRDTNVTVDGTRSAYRERFRRIARRNASRFAHFSSQDELGSHAHDVAGREIPLPESNGGVEDWPGPFSTAMKIIKDREGNRNGERHTASIDKSEAVELKWIPKNQESYKHRKQVPSLIELCLSVLSKNADAITSLDFVPDALRHKICWFLCDSRRMDGHFLELLVHGTPTEIRVRDCSWLSEELFTKTFEGFNASKLTVLQFDQCGGCMPDCTLHAYLARSPNSLPALTTISLKGAYSLSDAGLRMLVSAAPSLKSIDISQCPLLTSEGIFCLASSLRLNLKELYLDNCHGIDAMLILPALKKLENLEVLSVAGIQTVCDDFVSKFVSAHGCRMKELVLADCMELTDSSLEVIGDTCSDLQAIDLTNLCKLTDISIGHLANGCRAIHTLKLCRNAFSDEAIAAYLDVRGASLKDLALNNILQVSNHTALSLARNCRNLRSLDLSWCRSLTNEALGLIVDSCIFLEVLKLFGCTQVTNVFLDGHSNPQVKLIGLKMTPLLRDIDVPDFLLVRHLCLFNVFSGSSEVMD